MDHGLVHGLHARTYVRPPARVCVRARMCACFFMCMFSCIYSTHWSDVCYAHANTKIYGSVIIITHLGPYIMCIHGCICTVSRTQILSCVGIYSYICVSHLTASATSPHRGTRNPGCMHLFVCVHVCAYIRMHTQTGTCTKNECVMLMHVHMHNGA